MRSDRERLLDIAEAIAKIGKYSARGRDVFESDELIWDQYGAGMGYRSQRSSGPENKDRTYSEVDR